MKIISVIFLLLSGLTGNAQQIDSIYFHLYTDSLKKGVHNYISVDGRLPGGRWLPLTKKELVFSASAGKFEGNDLILPADFAPEKVDIRAALKNNPGTEKTISIWIKKKPDDEILPTKNEIMNSGPKSRRKKS